MPKLPRSTSSATSSMASGTIPSRPAKPHPDRLKIMHLFPDRPLAPGNIPLTQALHQRFDLDLLLSQRPADHARCLKLPLHLPEQRPLRWRGLGPHPLDRHRIPELALDRLAEGLDLPLHARAAR